MLSPPLLVFHKNCTKHRYNFPVMYGKKEKQQNSINSEVKAMDYSGYDEFPFPSNLSLEEEKAKEHFLSLSDEDQLRMLNGCRSYEEFRTKAIKSMAQPV